MIVNEAFDRVRSLESHRSDLEEAARSRPVATSLSAALRSSTVTLLTEVKRQSPSRGRIADHLDATGQARAYHAAGAAAISILTEGAHFGGSNEDLVAVHRNVPLPTLKKDFHVAPLQLAEAKALGASAALLIVRALSPQLLAEMMAAGRELELELLVEVRNEGELEQALSLGATMIGVNNRDLETLQIDPATAVRILPRIPASVVAIAESGVTCRADVERYGAAGADAVLVGSSLSASADPTTATRALTGVIRVHRDG